VVEVTDARTVRWVPTAVARKLLGVSKQRVYQLIESGALAANRVEGILLVSVRSIDDRLSGQKTIFDEREE